MIPSVDSYPINLKNSVIDIAYDYTKRKNVFKVVTFSNSEYLFQTVDNDSMLEWIRAMQENSTPPDLDKLLAEAAALNSSKASSSGYKSSETISEASRSNVNSTDSAKLKSIRQASFESNQTFNIRNSTFNSSKSSWSPSNDKSISSSINDTTTTTAYNAGNNTPVRQHHSKQPSKSLNNTTTFNMSSPDDQFAATTTSSTTPNSSNANMNSMISSSVHSRKEDSSPRRDSNNTNRKWVRQMTRRIRDFMTNTNTGELSVSNDHDATTHHHQLQSTNSLENMYTMNRNFGVPLDKCESSSVSPYVPVVVEVCTRLIELHIIDEGIYRKVGQKQVVSSLRAQLNKGILNIDISDYNWDNPHAVVSLLKSFLNELPDSLTTSRKQSPLPVWLSIF